MRNRWFLTPLLLPLLLLTFLFLRKDGMLPAAQAAPIQTAALVVSAADTPLPTTADPLPGGCRNVTPSGGSEPVCCISGYVYLDGVPVEGAQVTIQNAQGEIKPLQTQRLPDSSYAYYRLDLTHAFAAPVNPGELLIITASFQGLTRTMNYVVKAGGQQVDLVLPRPRVDAITPLPAAQIWQAAPTGLFFNKPMASAVDSQGHIYIVDRDNARIQKFDAAWNFIRQWGRLGNQPGEFWNPTDIAVDSSGQFVYVADTFNHRIQKFDSNGTFLAALGSYGTANGFFRNPQGVAVDSNGNLYVADTDNNRIQVFNSNFTFQTKYPNTTNTSSFSTPKDVAIDNQNNLYIADSGNNRVQICATTCTIIGSLLNPGGVAYQTASYIADTGNSRILKGATIKTAANGKNYSTPEDIFATPNLVYIADTGNHRIVTATLTLNATGEKGQEGNGAGQLHDPTAFAIDSSGNFYVVDSRFNQVKVLDQAGQPLRILQQPGVTNLVDVIVDEQQNAYVVANSSTPQILKFNNQGAFVQSWNLSAPATAVNDLERWNQTLYAIVQYGVGTISTRIDKYAVNGTKISEVAAPGGVLLQDLAIDSQGQLYAVDSNGRLWKSNGTNA